MPPRKPVRPVVQKKKQNIIDAEYSVVEDKPKRPALPGASRKKTVEVMDGTTGEVAREVDVPLSDDPEIHDGDVWNAAKAQMAKVPQKTGFATVGLGLGATLNMGDYQSARIDVFIIRNVPDTDAHIEGALQDISEKLHMELNRQAAILQVDEEEEE